jgi:hypothetical protein
MKLFIKELGSCEDHDFYVLRGDSIKSCRVIARCPTRQLADLILESLCKSAHPARIEQAAKTAHLGDRSNT